MFCLFLADANGSESPGKNEIECEENNEVELKHAVSHCKWKDFVVRDIIINRNN